MIGIRKFVMFKKAPENYPDGCGASYDRVKALAHSLWEKAGKPESQSDYFWHEAEKIVNTPEPQLKEFNWVCNQCGSKALYDGRCGDSPILMCGCGRAEPIPASQYRYNAWW